VQTFSDSLAGLAPSSRTRTLAAIKSLPKREVLNGNTLVRAILALVQYHDLAEELAAARDQAARATSVLKELAHDLATPLGVVMGMTQVLLADDSGLTADRRSCLRMLLEKRWAHARSSGVRPPTHVLARRHPRLRMSRTCGVRLPPDQAAR
jgi:signal transduction histidine kinase